MSISPSTSACSYLTDRPDERRSAAICTNRLEVFPEGRRHAMPVN
jgi:hypothetical protein